MQDYKDLRVWHLAHALSLKIIEALPPHTARKVPGLRNQAIRAASSVASQIVEGCSRTSRREFLRYVENALTELNELEAHLLLARDSALVPEAKHAELQRDIRMIRRMLRSLMRALTIRVAEDERADESTRSSAATARSRR